LRSYTPLIFALIAAFGNALFAMSQRRANGLGNSLTFVAIAAVIASLLMIAVTPILGPPKYLDSAKENVLWLALGGVGLFMTYIGFNILYARFGASYYVLYAVLAIVTTSVVVGVLVLREPFNVYHWGALACALAAVILFSLGQARVAR
jgi:drug/metabolite transporter (DMT)-like permease